MASEDQKDISAVLQEEDEIKDPEAVRLKLDARGVPLVPQPTDHKDDPLVYITLYFLANSTKLHFIELAALV